MNNLTTTVVAGIGFGIRLLWERYTKIKRETTLDIIEETRFRLQEFYYPIYYLLQEEAAIWRNFQLNPPKEFDIEFDNHNHNILREIRDIIHKNVVKARVCSDMSDLCDKFLKHVAVYGAMRRHSDSHEFPGAQGAAYPQDFKKKIQARIFELNTEYNRLLGKADFVDV